jgi:hypothetical protein
MPCAYQEDTNKKDQGWAFLDEGSTPPVPNQDSPAIMVAIAPAADEDTETNKTLSK